MLDSNVTFSFVELTIALLSAAFVGALVPVTVFWARIQNLKKQVGIDNLTKLYNCMEFKRRLSLELKRAKNARQPLSLVLMDIDHFKGVNDTYGYMAGDSVLIKLGGLIKSSLRHMDMAFRYKQGDEFAILMSETEASEALALIEDLQMEVGKYKFPVCPSPLGDNSVSLSLSAGIVGFDTIEDTVESFAERAELALRKAKQCSRQGHSLPAIICEPDSDHVVKRRFVST